MDETKVKLEAIRKLLEMPEPPKNNTESCWKEWYLRPDKENYNFLVRIPITVVNTGKEIGKVITVMCWVNGKLSLAWDHTPWDEEDNGRIGGNGTWKWMEIPE